LTLALCKATIMFDHYCRFKRSLHVKPCAIQSLSWWY